MGIVQKCWGDTKLRGRKLSQDERLALNDKADKYRYGKCMYLFSGCTQCLFLKEYREKERRDQ